MEFESLVNNTRKGRRNKIKANKKIQSEESKVEEYKAIEDDPYKESDSTPSSHQIYSKEDIVLMKEE
jgi:hypothetical protein